MILTTVPSPFCLEECPKPRSRYAGNLHLCLVFGQLFKMDLIDGMFNISIMFFILFRTCGVHVISWKIYYSVECLTSRYSCLGYCKFLLVMKVANKVVEEISL